MDSPTTDYNMHHPHPHHHHPHYHQHHHHPSGGSPSSAIRCPALRANAESRNYHSQAASPPRDNAFYDPVHGIASDRSHWQSRSPQRWQPARLPPHAYGHDDMTSMLPALAEPNQPPRNLPPYAMFGHQPEGFPYMQGTHRPSFRTLMQPVQPVQPMQPVLRPFDSREIANADVNHANSQHPSSYSGPRTEGGLNTPDSVLAAPLTSAMPLRPSRDPLHISQDTPVVHENPGPRQQPANFRLRDLLVQSESTPSQYAEEEPITRGNHTSRSELQSESVTVSSSPQRLHEYLNRANSLSEVVRRGPVMQGSRNMRPLPRAMEHTDWSGDNEDPMRPNLGLLEFVEGYPRTVQEGESPATPVNPILPHPVFRNSRPAKKVASKKAIASLQSVDLADLPESEKTCVICYNDFGVQSPEGINEAPLRLPKCGHVFGDHCIKTWFEDSDSCPYCRDKVHSEFQQLRPCRTPPAMRLMRQYQVQSQQMAATRQIQMQSQMQNNSHNRSPSNPEALMRQGQPLADLTMDPSNLSLDLGSHMRPQSSFPQRYDRNAELRPYSNPAERRPPPTDNDNSDRPRTRPRHSRSVRYNMAGALTTMNAPHSPVRRSRSRSRSPVHHENTRARASNHRSLIRSPQQFPRMDRSPWSRNQRDAMASNHAPRSFTLWAQTPPFLPQTGADNGDHQQFPSNDNAAAAANGQPVVLPSLHPDPLPSGGPENFTPEHSFPNQFTSFQQS
ncbi:hypothetical protein F5Y18DRAFT_422982 [Xylariaceae sp. FL1019]|nr:hypothetical protein F5Y18DRAFT_422982 [Xylariaceae sp. FL1019]